MSYGDVLNIVLGSACVAVALLILMAQTPALALRSRREAENHFLKLIEILKVVGH